MENIFGNVFLERAPVFDLLAAMFQVLNYEKLKPENLQSQKYSSEKLKQWVEETRKALTEKDKEELKLFFNFQSFPGFGLLDLVLREGQHLNLNDFFQFIEKVSREEILQSFLQAGYLNPAGGLQNVSGIETAAEALEFLENRKLPEKERWKLLYLFVNGEETVNRFLSLIKGFYYDFFYHQMEWISLTHHKSINDLKQEFTQDPEGKFSQLLKFDYQALKDVTQIIFIPSYFLDTSFIITYDYITDRLIYLYGVQRPVLIFNQNDLHLIKALKAISEEKRLQIFQSLKKGPLYGSQLVEELGLANSTISHHLSVLADQGLVEAQRVENRVYYGINKEKAAELLEDIKQILS